MTNIEKGVLKIVIKVIINASKINNSNLKDNYINYINILNYINSYINITLNNFLLSDVLLKIMLLHIALLRMW